MLYDQIKFFDCAIHNCFSTKKARLVTMYLEGCCMAQMVGNHPLDSFWWCMTL